ncbi:hypothetical protein [Halomarina rubra]|uniref:Uncharacterized protein n=1 Tax=Halomarina rubra TaxID=2071873 RepID=A0ABD6AV79_9EURY|nr:hypothetical protein [Halomarina rubra]
MAPIELLGVTFLGSVVAVLFGVLSWALSEQAQHYESTEPPRRLLLAERVLTGLMFLSFLVGAGALIAYCAMVFADISEVSWQITSTPPT